MKIPDQSWKLFAFSAAQWGVDMSPIKVFTKMLREPTQRKGGPADKSETVNITPW